MHSGFLELYNLYYRDVYLYLYSLSHSKEMAEDLTTEVFIAVFKSLHLFKNESSLKTWIMAIAKHKWFDYLRCKQKDLITLEDERFDCKDLAILENYNYLQDFLNDFLKNESAMNKFIFLKRIEGYSYLEIAEELHLKENTVRVTYFRLKNRFKDYLIKEGGLNE